MAVVLHAGACEGRVSSGGGTDAVVLVLRVKGMSPVAEVLEQTCSCCVQVLRVKGVSPVAEVLTQTYSCFLDEKDRAGTLVLSHVYLLVGLSAPLWIVSIINDPRAPTCGGAQPPPLSSSSSVFSTDYCEDPECPVPGSFIISAVDAVNRCVR